MKYIRICFKKVIIHLSIQQASHLYILYITYYVLNHS